MSALLETRTLTRNFAGVIALADVTLRIQSGERRAIIGPNGAGKTTFANLVTGRLRPTSGRVHFMAQDITEIPAHRRARMGIGYTFQLTSVFPRLSVSDNVRLSVQARDGAGFRPLGGASDARVEAGVVQILERVGLEGSADASAGGLSHGDQRRLELAIALGLKPKLLILDEPTQGMAAGEVTATVQLIRELSEVATVLLIEHNMDVVFQLAERITVLDHGRVIAEGTADEISGNRLVQQVYLGRPG